MNFLHPYRPLARIATVGLALCALVTASGCASEAIAATRTNDSATVVSSSAPATSKPLVLAPSGLGRLHLGMSKRAALATGMVGAHDANVQLSTGCRVYDGRHGAALVYFSHGKVEIISVRPSIRTSKGIGVGDTYRALHRKYPDTIDEAGLGRVYGVAKGAPIKAHYRFEVTGTHPKSKVTAIALQGDNQSCYE